MINCQNLDELTNEEIQTKIAQLKFDILMIKNQIAAEHAEKVDGLPGRGHRWLSKATTAKRFLTAQHVALTEEMHKRSRAARNEKMEKIKDFNFYFVEAARATLPNDTFFELIGIAQSMTFKGEL